MKLVNNTLFRMSMGRSFSEENGEAEKVRGLVTDTYALTKKMFLVSLLHRPLKKFRILLSKREVMGFSDRISELLDRILVEHKEKQLEENQGMDMIDEFLAAYGDENADYNITWNHIKSFFAEPQIPQCNQHN